jgi:hypothetical protein
VRGSSPFPRDKQSHPAHGTRFTCGASRSLAGPHHTPHRSPRPSLKAGGGLTVSDESSRRTPRPSRRPVSSGRSSSPSPPTPSTYTPAGHQLHGRRLLPHRFRSRSDSRARPDARPSCARANPHGLQPKPKLKQLVLHRTTRPETAKPDPRAPCRTRSAQPRPEVGLSPPEPPASAVTSPSSSY